MKTFQDHIADFITEQEQHNPRRVNESHDFTTSVLRKFQEDLNRENKGPGKWQSFRLKKYVDKVRKLTSQASFNLADIDFFAYLNKSGNKVLADTTIVIMAHFDTESFGSAKLYIYSKEHSNEPLVISWSKRDDAMKKVNEMVRKELDASNQAYLRSLD